MFVENGFVENTLALSSTVDDGVWSKSEPIDEEAILSAGRSITNFDERRPQLSSVGIGHRLVKTVASGPSMFDGKTVLHDCSDTPSSWGNALVSPSPLYRGKWVVIPNEFSMEFLHEPNTSTLPWGSVGLGFAFKAVYEPVAASLSATTEIERSDGVLVIDIGKQSSGCAVWQNSNLESAFGMSLSTERFMRNLAYRVDKEPNLGSEADGLRQSSSVDEYLYTPVARCIAERFARLLLAEMIEGGLNIYLLPPTIVLTGGGAVIHGLDEAIRNLTNRDVRIGVPVGLLKLPSDVRDPHEWCVAVGLADRALNLSIRKFWNETLREDTDDVSQDSNKDLGSIDF